MAQKSFNATPNSLVLKVAHTASDRPQAFVNLVTAQPFCSVVPRSQPRNVPGSLDDKATLQAGPGRAKPFKTTLENFTRHILPDSRRDTSSDGRIGIQSRKHLFHRRTKGTALLETLRRLEGNFSRGRSQRILGWAFLHKHFLLHRLSHLTPPIHLDVKRFHLLCHIQDAAATGALLRLRSLQLVSLLPPPHLSRPPQLTYSHYCPTRQQCPHIPS